MEITWKGSPNCTPGRSGYAPVAICNHIMQGSIEGTNGWFNNPGSQVSAHFGVAKDGRIWQWVKVEDEAWANGVLQEPDTSIPWIAGCVSQGINPNNLTISIEHEGMSGVPFPEAQYQATLWLHRKLIADNKQNIAATRQHIIGHYQIDNVSRHNCPGSFFPWTRLMADLQGAPPPPPPFDPNPNGFSVGPGMLEKLKELQLQAATDEQYGNFGPHLGQRSMLWTSTAGIKLEAFQELDAAYNPTGNWDIRAVKEL